MIAVCRSHDRAAVVKAPVQSVPPLMPCIHLRKRNEEWPLGRGTKFNKFSILVKNYAVGCVCCPSI